LIDVLSKVPGRGLRDICVILSTIGRPDSQWSEYPLMA